MEFDERAYLLSKGGSAVASNAPETLEDIKIYYEVLESFLSSSLEERLGRTKSILDKVGLQPNDERVREDNTLLWEDYFPSELRASVLVSIMSFFERYLNGVCAETAIVLRTDVSHKQLKGSAIDRSRTYLSDICKIERPSPGLWEKVKSLQQLRNTLVHNGGMLETEQELKRIRGLLEKMEGASCSELGVELEPEFIRYTFALISEFLIELSMGLESLCSKVKRFEEKLK